MKCKACGENRGYMNNGLPVCSECMNPLSMKMITKKHAQKRYVLTKKDLEGVRHALGWHSGPTNIPSSLYIIDDIEKIAIQKYGGIENVIKRIKERDNKKIDMNKRNKDIKITRRRELGKYLAGLGINWQENLPICQDYIEKGPHSEYTLEMIGNIMLETEFFQKMTDYKKQIKLVTTEFKYTFGRSFDNQDVQNEAMDRCLHQYVKENYMNHHKMIDELPPSLRSRALEISSQYYSDSSFNVHDCLN